MTVGALVASTTPQRGSALRVVAYLRVSTDRQADHGFGLDVQEAAVTAWTKQHRGRLVEVCRDAGRSGADDLLDRPALARALGRIRAGHADTLLVARVDRLARDLILQEWLRAELVRDGAQLRSADPVEDLYLAETDDPTGKLVRRILGAIAEYEREMIALRMAAGKAAKAAGGGYAHGRPAYGWRADGGELVRDIEQQRVITRVKRAARDGASTRAIAERLNADGVPSPAGKTWSAQAVARVLNRRRGGDTPVDKGRGG